MEDKKNHEMIKKLITYLINFARRLETPFLLNITLYCITLLCKTRESEKKTAPYFNHIKFIFSPQRGCSPFCQLTPNYSVQNYTTPGKNTRPLPPFAAVKEISLEEVSVGEGGEGVTRPSTYLSFDFSFDFERVALSTCG